MKQININTKNKKHKDALQIGDIVEQEFNQQLMKVIGFQPELVENVITQWEDEMGNIIVGKFIASELKIVKQ